MVRLVNCEVEFSYWINVMQIFQCSQESNLDYKPSPIEIHRFDAFFRKDFHRKTFSGSLASRSNLLGAPPAFYFAMPELQVHVALS